MKSITWTAGGVARTLRWRPCCPWPREGKGGGHPQAVPVGERLRPDAELQRLGRRAVRAARHVTASTRRSRAWPASTSCSRAASCAYLLLHDPEYRRVRREHLVEVGPPHPPEAQHRPAGRDPRRTASRATTSRSTWSRPRPKRSCSRRSRASCPPDHIHATRFRYDEVDGRDRVDRARAAGYGKVARHRRAAAAART